MQNLQQTSYLGSDSSSYLEELYEQYLIDPNSIEKRWRDYFDLVAPKGQKEVAHSQVQGEFLNLARHKQNVLMVAQPQTQADLEHERKQVKVLQLINAYRSRGHQNAKLDPLELSPRPYLPELELSHYGFTETDLVTKFDADKLGGKNREELREIYTDLNYTYCASIGAEYMYLTDTIEKEWIKNRIEPGQARPNFTAQKKLRLYERLNAAEGLERYLHAKYVGQKRFSLEGGDSMIPMLDELIQRAGSKHNTREIVIGMAHRGRLNVLVNVLGKSPRWLFAEFEGKHNHDLGTGDVKYHQGFSSDIRTEGGEVHVALAFNPSHLEIVAPVVEGSVRARQEHYNDQQRNEIIPIILHGDAAFAGQGVVMETFSMSQARGYCTGGTVHIIINNQIGFTTSNPLDSRSTFYCTDVAKMVQAPIFHVNGDDPEAVLFVTQLALDYRMQFKKDVVIDLVCYRRHGHNEADEPAATQPVMYNTIRQKLTTRQLYAQQLIEEGVLTADEESKLLDKYRDMLDAEKVVARDVVKEDGEEPMVPINWQPYLHTHWYDKVNTGYDLKKFQQLAKQIYDIPAGFQLQTQVGKMMADRRKMAEGEISVDWGFAEVMAYATLLTEKYSVRLSGQDSGRGTFAHRHAVLHDQSTDTLYIPLEKLAQEQNNHFIVIDSFLSEEAVLGFEYGYASADPEELVLWEAQFGDFANGAQVVIDQFISSGEHKWGRLCGLVMLLPHGYEGQGPEHSSARLERYLQLCAGNNMQVCVPSTPAQIFHLLRRQMIRPYRKPLVVMTPKSLLRHKLAVSTQEELTGGEFQLVIPEIDDIKADKVKRVIMCSGKVYYDLLAKRRADKIDNIAIIRIEQLYPFPEEELKAELAKYKNANDIVWCQEEPVNQGAWYNSQHRLLRALAANQTLSLVARPASSAPSVGYLAVHVAQQAELVAKALSFK
jgi:2-oxoglutarate dehydrogenase E1 component